MQETGSGGNLPFPNRFFAWFSQFAFSILHIQPCVLLMHNAPSRD